ncbi:SAM-dependent methyltransferase [Deltaproteobacteria bacterium IMCC39524]|nr:SAM-dependent methyltransferase [Deltaproteobacteria bacterium IMCC39524]
MSHQIYFLGAGPGDPELLTRRAERLLIECRVVYLPPMYDQPFAEFLEGKELFVPFEYYFSDLIEQIKSHLINGPVAFLVPGDLTFYSPFQALVDALGPLAVVVPGVGSANAASALLKKTLDLPGVCSRAILASPRTLGDGPDAPTMGDFAEPGVSLLIYMNNIPLPELVAQLRKGYGTDTPIALAHRVGLPDEEVVVATLDTIVATVGSRDYFNLDSPNPRPALTLILVGESLTAEADPAWWDYRRDNIWKYQDNS